MNYTRQASEALRIAREVARDLEHPYIGTEHLLIGIKRVHTGVGGQVLGMNGVKDDDILKIMNELVSPVGDVATKNPETSPRLDIR